MQMLTNRLVELRKGNSKSICDECDKIVRVRTIVKIRGKFLCITCQKKRMREILKK